MLRSTAERTKRVLRTPAHDRLARALAPLHGQRDVYVLRDVKLHRGEVGHVVVCPGGVYVIDPRRWRGTVRLRRGRLQRSGVGTSQAFRDVLDGATLIRRRLASSGIVRGVGAVIALTDGTLPDGPIDLREVDIVEASQLPAWLGGRRLRLEPIEIEAIRYALTPHD